jgi:hypothetical protein
MLLSFLPNPKKGEHKMSTKISNSPKLTKDPEPIEENKILDRIHFLEARVIQLEAILSVMEKEVVTFENLASRLVGSTDTGNKKERKHRAKRILTPEEKAAFHARMVAGRLAKEKACKEASKK